MEIIIIVAVSENSVIGRNNKMPWHISDDLKWFKLNTYGFPVIMGRFCYESLGKPLPGRTNIVLTKNMNYKADGCFIAHSPEEALEMAIKCNKKRVFIAGGGKIYSIFLKYAEKIYLTKVYSEFTGDTFFKMNEKEWKEVWREDHLDGEPYSYSFIKYEKN
jgi:dihydrofolate reductase